MESSVPPQSTPAVHGREPASWKVLVAVKSYEQVPFAFTKREKVLTITTPLLPVVEDCWKAQCHKLTRLISPPTGQYWCCRHSVRISGRSCAMVPTWEVGERGRGCS